MFFPAIPKKRIIIPRTRPLTQYYKRFADSLLRTDLFEAHSLIRLVLLPSRPDTVYGKPLHEAHSSTPLTGSIPYNIVPRTGNPTLL